MKHCQRFFSRPRGPTELSKILLTFLLFVMHILSCNILPIEVSYASYRDSRSEECDLNDLVAAEERLGRLGHYPCLGTAPQ